MGPWGERTISNRSFESKLNKQCGCGTGVVLTDCFLEGPSLPGSLTNRFKQNDAHRHRYIQR